MPAGGPSRWVVALVGAATVLVGQPAPAQEPPRFRSGVSLLTIDATVVDQDWRPHAGLTAEDFDVEIDGRRRPVSTLDYFAFEELPYPDAPGAPVSPAAKDPRTFVLLADDGAFGPVEERPLLSAAERFVRALPASDRVGVVAASGRPALSPTTDRAAVLAALTGVRGSYRSPKRDASTVIPGYGIIEARQFAFDELLAMSRNDRTLLANAARRELGSGCEGDEGCLQEIRLLAAGVVRETEALVARQLRGWRMVAESLGRLPGFKVLVVLSGGLLAEFSRTVIDAFAREVARRGIVLHVLGTTRTGAGAEYSAPVGSRGTQADHEGRDARLFQDGLQDAAARSGGMFQLVAGTAERHFERVRSASAARYRLGIELPGDVKPGADVRARVRLKRPGLRIFAGTAFTAPGPPVELTTEEQLKLAIGQGNVYLGVSMMMVPQVRRSPDRTSLELGLHVEVPAPSRPPFDVMFAVIGDAGRVVQAGRTRVEQPAGVAASRFSFALPVPPGEYRVRLGVADASGSVGSVEQGVSVRLARMGAFLASQMAARWAGPAGDVSLLAAERVPEDATRLDVGLELYRDAAAPAPASALARVRLLDESGANVLSGELPLSPGETSWYAGLDVPLATLAPGEYSVEIAVEADGARVGVATKGLIKTAPVMATLPDPETVLGLLRRDAGSLRPTDLSPFLAVAEVGRHLSLLPAGVTGGRRPDGGASESALWSALEAAAQGGGDGAPFVRGLLALRASQPEQALAAFEVSLEQAPDALSVMLYLGAANAALGRDRDAAGAWSLALGDDRVGVDWHLANADALVRAGDPSGALLALEDARARWPDDGRVLVRLGERLLAAGRFEEGRAALESAAGRAPEDERRLFLLTALAFADVAREPGSATARERFAVWSSRYLTVAGSDAAPVAEWVKLVAQRPQ